MLQTIKYDSYTVEYIQYDGSIESRREIMTWCDKAVEVGTEFFLITTYGLSEIRVGDFIINDSRQGFSVVFEERFKEVFLTK